jgi:hypothetical protein
MNIKTYRYVAIAHCSVKMVLAWEKHYNQVVGLVWVDNFQDSQCSRPYCRRLNRAQEMNPASYWSQAMEQMMALLVSFLRPFQLIE